MRSVLVNVTGKVQGVFYRASTQQKAQQLGVNGWVKNNSDGSVTFYACGDESAANALIEWAKQGPEYAVVRGIELREADVEECSEFEVRY